MHLPGGCLTLTLLLPRTIGGHLRRDSTKRPFHVIRRLHLCFSHARGLADRRPALSLSRPAMSDRLLGLL
jgi:hypothetical protein